MFLISTTAQDEGTSTWKAVVIQSGVSVRPPWTASSVGGSRWSSAEHTGKGAFVSLQSTLCANEYKLETCDEEPRVFAGTRLTSSWIPSAPFGIHQGWNCVRSENRSLHSAASSSNKEGNSDLNQIQIYLDSSCATYLLRSSYDCVFACSPLLRLFALSHNPDTISRCVIPEELDI